jgi:hypothetical protein
MSNRYVAINRGLDGFKISDFTLGTSSSAGSDVELRIADTDANGKALTRLDIQKALRAFERELASGAIFSSFPPL